MKICTKCGIQKSLDNFHKHIRSKDGLRTMCKECRKVPSSEYHKANAEKISIYNKQWRLTNSDKCKAYRLNYYETNKETILYNQKLDRIKSPTKHKLRRRKGYLKNKEYILCRNKEYRIKNKDMLNRVHTKWRKSCPLNTLKHRVRSLINQSFRYRKYSKTSSAYNILGADYTTVWNHLKTTWLRNYGFEWNGQPYHIDHIKPLKLAINKEDVIKLNHYTNLQLLTPIDNMVKGSKYEVFCL